MKELFLEVVGNEEDESEKIGGPGIRIQIDETVICNGLVISNRSNELDNLPSVQWILGGVVEGDYKNFFLKLVPNRKSEVLIEVFKDHIHPGSVIVTDGYPSYRSAVHEFGSTHDVVNHSLGFVTTSGVNTNQAETMWSHLKQDYRARSGLNRKRIHFYLKEFSWKKNI